MLGQSLKNLTLQRSDVVIATKVYGRVGPGRNAVGTSRGHILDSIEGSLRRLQNGSRVISAPASPPDVRRSSAPP